MKKKKGINLRKGMLIKHAANTIGMVLRFDKNHNEADIWWFVEHQTTPSIHTYNFISFECEELKT